MPFAEMPVKEQQFCCWGQTLAGWLKEGQGVPILALHGWLDNANSFAPLAAHLPNPLLAVDFSGHGHSAHRPADVATHYIDHVRDVLAVADAVGWGKFILLGHSMGAGVASLFAATFPERINKLVLLEGLGPPTEKDNMAAVTLKKAIVDMQALAIKRKPVYAEFDDAVRARCAGFGGLSEGCSRLLCERGLKPVSGGWTWRADARLRLTSSLRLTESQVAAFLQGITVPTLLVAAQQGMVGADGYADDYVRRIEWVKNIQVAHLSGRHHVHMEAPQRVAQAMLPFCMSPNE